MVSPSALSLRRPRLAEVFDVLGLSRELANWQTPFALTVLHLGGKPRDIGLFEALGYFGETDPLAAWESIITHDLSPARWGHEARTFSADPEMRSGMRKPEASVLVSTPPTLRACVAFGSDPSGVAQAEEIALEFFRRRHPHRPTFSGTIHWRLSRSHTFLRDSEHFRSLLNEADDDARALNDMLDQLNGSRYGIVQLNEQAIVLVAPCLETGAWW